MNTRPIELNLIEEGLQLDDVELAEVEPTRSLCVAPRPCELKTAQIRKDTIKDMKEGNRIRVARRYAQNNAGQQRTLKEAILCGLLGLLIISSLIKKINTNSNYSMDATLSVLFVLSTLIGALTLCANVPPNVCNTLRYRETKNACEQWLQSKVSEKCLKKIKQVRYDDNIFFKLEEIFAAENKATDNDMTVVNNKYKLP